MKTKKVRPLLVESKFNSLEELQGKFIIRDNKLYTCGQLNSLKMHEKKIGDRAYQLILISLDPDENIKIGDKFALEGQNEPDVYEIFINDGEEGLLDANCKKVISTQENISPQYISKFVEEYNNGCVKDLEIEMEYFENDTSECIGMDGEPNGIPFNGFAPKLTNNYITIVEKEPIMYSEEEMATLCYNAMKEVAYTPYIVFSNWFNDNKKK